MKGAPRRCPFPTIKKGLSRTEHSNGDRGGRRAFLNLSVFIHPCCRVYSVANLVDHQYVMSMHA